MCIGGVIKNGSFESPSLTRGTFATINTGAEPSRFAWKVSSGNVDILHLPVSPFVQFSAFQGNQALDLNGLVRGTIFQEFATIRGHLYKLSFAFADNPFAGGVSTANVSVTDMGSLTSLLVATIMHSTSANGPPAKADWHLYTNMFKATSTKTRLAFVSTSPSNSASGGIILDAVSVTVVPEPSSHLFLGFLSAVGVALRQYKKSRAKPNTKVKGGGDELIASEPS